MIFFRADANKKIATGHIMRCATIAREFMEIGCKVCFLVADLDSQRVVESQGLPIIRLNTRWDNMDEEIPQIASLLDQYQATWLVVDSYFVTQNYFHELRQRTRVAYIDDLNACCYECDAIINYAVYADDLNYPAQYRHTQLLLGSSYAPLRKNFRGLAERAIRQTVTHILVLTGGGDTYHVAQNIVDNIMEESDRWVGVTFHIVCGMLQPDFTELVAASRKCENIQIYSHVEHIERLMLQADIAISAGGSTLYELCSCGTPTITYSMADNQLKNVETFDRLDLMEYSGDVRYDFSYHELMDKLSVHIENWEKRSIRSKQLQQVADGWGAKRIAETLCAWDARRKK